MLLTQMTLHPIYYSFSSVLMAIAASTLLLIVISVCLYFDALMVNAGYKLLSLFLVFTLLRFVVPIELPFSRNMFFPQKLSDIVAFICHEYISYRSISLSIWNLLEIIWLIGSVVQFLRLLKSYMHCRRYLLLSGTDITDREPYKSTLDRICREHHKPNCFRLLMLDDIPTPTIYGIFSPHILIPAGMELSPVDLYYTLSHEASHHFHRDLLIKMGVNILAVVYWWNPAVYLLKARANLLLEMRIDDHITHRDRSNITSYLSCLLHIKEYTAEKSPLSPNVSLAIKERATDLEKRFLMLCKGNNPRIYTLNILLTLLIVGVYLASYVFIFEAYSYPEPTYVDENDVIYYYLPMNYTYLIENADGTYDVYLDSPENPDFYLETIDSLEYYNHGYTIYYLEKGRFK